MREVSIVLLVILVQVAEETIICEVVLQVKTLRGNTLFYLQFSVDSKTLNNKVSIYSNQFGPKNFDVYSFQE